MLNLYFVLRILQKIKETRSKFSQGSVAVLQKMANYQEVTVKLKNIQLHIINWQKLILKTRQTTKTRNALANNMSTDIKVSKAQISKIIQSGGPFDCWLSNLDKEALTNIAIT